MEQSCNREMTLGQEMHLPKKSALHVVQSLHNTGISMHNDAVMIRDITLDRRLMLAWHIRAIVKIMRSEKGRNCDACFLEDYLDNGLHRQVGMPNLAHRLEIYPFPILVLAKKTSLSASEMTRCCFLHL